MVHTYDIYPSSSSTCIESDEIKRYWSTSWQVKDKNHIKSGQNAEKTWTKPGQNLDKNPDKARTKLRQILIVFGSNFF